MAKRLKPEECIPALSTFLHFCKILDLHRTRLANGQFTDKFCAACENENHNPRAMRPCACPCHEAWKLRREIERRIDLETVVPMGKVLSTAEGEAEEIIRPSDRPVAEVEPA
jgi:hypothetical protein